MVKLLDPHDPLASIRVTSSPTEGERGRLTVIGLVEVLAKICAPATEV